MRTHIEDYLFIFVFFFLKKMKLSLGFNKSSYKFQDTHSLIQISYPTKPMLMCL
jgi:hypothetical protein